jgi:hypothetical protein
LRRAQFEQALLEIELRQFVARGDSRFEIIRFGN